ncbi:hypothetical protein ACOR62_01355 [Neisseria lisongii]|uniref:Yip1 domain-containing protein n=1 Tax=Neisseria lisongii TaxID=2912188 RepID=A0AAW5AH23_9NEIS|nr:hypothetical protein [Neisseria lisongii]MCF7529117.1 hypothetical protein [Neisseria lisongii]
MLYQFFKDMLDIVRLRFRAPEEYHYPLSVTLAAVLLLGLMNAAGVGVFFVSVPVAVAAAMLMTAAKWYVLSRVMRRVLKRKNEAAVPLWGFTLVSEALAAPMLVLLYEPTQVVALVCMFWQTWIFWTQFAGFMKLGRASFGRVLLGYAVYVCAVVLVVFLLLMVFLQLGWLDIEGIRQQFETMQNAG